MNNDTEIKQRILEFSINRFFKSGFSNVTMDEMAQELGISKKTLYKYFDSKDALVRESLKTFTTSSVEAFNKIIFDDSIEFITKLKMVMEKCTEVYSSIGDQFFQDLRRGMPDLLKETLEWRNAAILSTFGKLVQDGMGKGIFRKDIDQKVVVFAYMSAVHGVLNPELVSQLPLSMPQVASMLIRIFYEGIMVEEVRRSYRDKFSG